MIINLITFTFGDLCDVGVCDANVRDPLQVSKGPHLNGGAFQRIRAHLWKGMERKTQRRQNELMWAGENREREEIEEERLSFTESPPHPPTPDGSRQHTEDTWINTFVLLWPKQSCASAAQRRSWWRRISSAAPDWSRWQPDGWRSLASELR